MTGADPHATTPVDAGRSPMSISKTRPIPRLIGLAGAFLLAIGAVMMYGTPGQASPHPLDDYPGFGRSPDAVVRDDTIAYFEAYDREQHIGGCMADAGFEYTPDVEYPLDAMRTVAASLDVDTVDADAGLDHPAEENQAYEDALSVDEREAYYQTLYGERSEERRVGKERRAGGRQGPRRNRRKD